MVAILRGNSSSTDVTEVHPAFAGLGMAGHEVTSLSLADHERAMRAVLVPLLMLLLFKEIFASYQVSADESLVFLARLALMRGVLAVGTEYVVAALALKLLLLQEALTHIRHLYIFAQGAVNGRLSFYLAAEYCGVECELQVLFERFVR